MNQQLRSDADTIVRQTIRAVLPDAAVRRALEGRRFSGRLFLVAVGKAACRWPMAAVQCLDTDITDGVVITKYGHGKGPLPGCRCFEAGHPVPDENSFRATQAALDLVSGAGAGEGIPCCFSCPGAAVHFWKSR